MEEINLREWIEKWDAGEIAEKVRFGRILIQVHNDFLLDNYRVWWCKNNEMRFEPLDRNLRSTHYFGISVDNLRSSAKYAVWTARNNLRDEVCFSHMREVVSFLDNWRA